MAIQLADRSAIPRVVVAVPDRPAIPPVVVVAAGAAEAAIAVAAVAVAAADTARALPQFTCPFSSCKVARRGEPLSGSGFGAQQLGSRYRSSLTNDSIATTTALHRGSRREPGGSSPRKEREFIGPLGPGLNNLR